MPEGARKLQGWFAELRRRKVFRVAVVYVVVAWLVIQVADAVFEPLGLPAWTLRLVIVLALLAVRIGDAGRARELVQRSLVAARDTFSGVCNEACTYALLGDREQALVMLDRAITHGRGNLGWIEHDGDLDSLRGDPRFEAILDRLRSVARGETN